VLYGYEPRHFAIALDDAVSVPDLSVWLQERHVMNELVKQHLLRAKERMKRQADKGRSERVFQVGDWVFLKAQPYVQLSLAPRANQKLAFKFFVPFQVFARVGAVAYKLKLPATTLVHPVFHVSQLKKMLGEHQQVTEALPDASFQWSILEKILQRRIVTREVHQVAQVLIMWSNVAATLATREDVDALKQQFPLAAVWGQPVTQEGGGDVTSAKPNPDPADGPRRSARPRKVNTRVAGPEWE
jgi:hypothetical protein